MKKIIFLLAIILMASFSFLSAQIYFAPMYPELASAEKGICEPHNYPKADAVLKYITGNPTVALGTNSYTGTRYTSGCISFTQAQMYNYVGATLHQINVGVAPSTSMANLTSYKIWIKKALDGPVVYEQTVTPVLTTAYHWENYTLTTNYTITNDPLVIGFTATFSSASAATFYPLACSNTPADTYKEGGFNYINASTSPTAHGAGASWMKYTTAGNLAIEALVTNANPLPTNDLAASSISANNIKWVGNQSVFTVTVYNTGSASQNNFNVQLLDASNAVLATSTTVTTPLAAGASTNVNINYAPTSSADLVVKGKVVLAGDQVSGNDVTAPLTCKVYNLQPMGYCWSPPHYTSAYGPSTTAPVPTEGHAAIGYLSADMTPFVGKQLTAFEICLPTPASGMTGGTIWIRNSTTGTNLHSQTFTPVEGWQTITLTTPYLLTNANTFIGYTVGIPAVGAYPLAYSGNTPANANGGHFGIFLSSAPAWTSLGGLSPAVIGNMSIIGVVENATGNVTINTAVSPSGSGNVTGGGSYAVGAPVTLTANANSGYTFQNWTPGGSTANPLTFNASVNATYTANFQSTSTGDCNPPSNLNVTYSSDCSAANLTWTAPAGKGAVGVPKTFKEKSILSTMRTNGLNKPNKREGVQNNSKNLWDLLWSFNAGTLQGSLGNYGILMWNGDLYIPKWSISTSNPSGRVHKYVRNGNNWVYDSYITITGLQTGTGVNVEGFCIVDNYVYACNGGRRIYKINPATWVAESYIQVPNGYLIDGLTYDPVNSVFYGHEYADDYIYKINPTTGAILQTIEADFVIDIAWENTSNGTPYLWIQTGYDTDLDRINLTTGAYEVYAKTTGDVPNMYAYADAGAGLTTAIDPVSGHLALIGICEGDMDIVFAYDLVDGGTTPGDVTYNIYRDGGTTPIATVATESYSDPTFSAGAGHTWEVKAVCPAGGESSATSKTMPACGESGGDCEPAQNLVAAYNANCSTASLTWDAPVGKSMSNGPVVVKDIFENNSPARSAMTNATANLMASSTVASGTPDYTPFVAPKTPKAVLYDNGPMITHIGVGPGGTDYSSLKPGQNILGAGFDYNLGYKLADDFTLTESTIITEIDFFGIQQGSNTSNVFTHVYVEIYNGAPNAGGTLIWGDMTTNRIASSVFSGIYRTDGPSSPSLVIPIMKVTANIGGLELPAGTYWVAVSTLGPSLSIPYTYGNPVTVWNGNPVNPNALVYQSSGWEAWLDDGGTWEALALPFIIHGPDNPEAAKAPTNLTVTPFALSLNGNVSWTNPTHNLAGDPLTSITKMVLLRDDAIIQEFPTAAVGEAMTYQDVVSNPGTHCYAVYAVTDAGNGLKAKSCADFGNQCEVTVQILSYQYGDSYAWKVTDDATGAVVLTGGTSTGTYKGFFAGNATFTLYHSGGYQDNDVELKVFVEGVEVFYLNVVDIPNGYSISHALTCSDAKLYAVYRNNFKIADTKKTYYDDTKFDSSDEHTWAVRVYCDMGGESAPIEASLAPCGNICPNDPATDLAVVYDADCTMAALTWTPPVGKAMGAPVTAPVVENTKVDRSVKKENLFTNPAMRMSARENGTSSSSEHTFTIPGKGPNTVAYAIDCYPGSNNATTVPLNNPASGTYIGGALPGLPTGADWVNGEWIAVNVENNNIYKVNQTNGSYQVVATHTVPDPVLGFAYYDADGFGYASTDNDLWRINLTTGATTHVTATPTFLYCFVITKEGRFIGMTSNPNIELTQIIEVNPACGAVTVLATASFFAWYVQDMAIDREDGMIYWAACDPYDWYSAAGGNMYKFDLATNQLTYMGLAPNGGAEMVGFAIPTSTNVQNLAKAPSNVVATPNGTELNGTISWTNPTQTVGGAALTIEKIVVKQNGTQIWESTGTITPGAPMTHNISVPNAGEYSFQVYAVTSAGNGLVAGACAVFGNMCEVKLLLQGDWSDSWDGGSIEVSVGGITYGTITATSAYSVNYVLIPSGEVQFTYNAGYYSDDECWFSIFDAAGNMRFDAPFGSLSGLHGNFFSYIEACGGISYHIYRDGGSLAYSIDPAYNDITFHPDQGHKWTVRVVCSDGTETEPISIIKNACNGSCNGPTNLQGVYTEECDMVLTWEAPAGKAPKAPKANFIPTNYEPVTASNSDPELDKIKEQEMINTPKVIDIEAKMAAKKAMNAERIALQSNATPKSSKAVIFSQDFETTADGGIPTGWFRTSIPGYDGWMVDRTYYYGYQESDGLVVSWWDYGLGNKNDWMITSGISLTAGAQYTIKFYAAMGWSAGDGNNLEVRVGATQTVAGMTAGTQIYTTTNKFTPDWELITSTFTPTTTGTYYIGFRDFTPDGDGFDILIDDITVEGSGTPPPPTSDCEDVVITATNNGNYYDPLPGWYGWSRNIILFEAGELGTAGIINSVALNIQQIQASQRPMKIYLMHTTASTLDAQYIWNNMKAAATLVYDQSVGFSAAGWQTFVIDPFEYNGTENLLVLIEGTGCTTSGGCAAQAYYSTKPNCHWYSRKDVSAPDDHLLVGTRNNNRPNITFEICQPGYKIEYEIYRDGELVGTTTELTFTDTDFDPFTPYTWCVQMTCEDGGYSNPICIEVDKCACDTDPVENLQGTYNKDCSIDLTWDKAVGKSAGFNVIEKPFVAPECNSNPEMDAQKEQMAAVESLLCKTQKVSPVEGGDTKAVWDLMWNFDLTVVHGAGGSYAPFLWGDKLYISEWNGTKGQVFRYAKSGSTWVSDGSITIPGIAGSYNFEGFTTDGEFIYGVTEGANIYKINPATWTVSGTIPVSGTPIAIAYDSNNDGFWIAPWEGTTATLVSRTGSVISTLTGGYSISGLAWEKTSDGTPYLWVSSGAGGANLHRWNCTTGAFSMNAHVTTDVPGLNSSGAGAGIFYGMYTPEAKMVLLCVNEGGTGINNRCFAYDFGISGTPCEKITNLTAIVENDNNVKLTWTAAPGSPTGYDILFNNAPLTNVTGTTYTHTGVAPGNHTYTVKAIFTGGCVPIGVNASVTINEYFGNCLAKIVGTATTTDYRLPVNTYWGYSYSQQIYDASDIGESGTITNIAFEYIRATPTYPTFVNIYMGHTGKSTFASNSDYVNIADLELVFSGNVDFNSTDQWYNIALDNGFEYEGGNLIVAIQNNKGSNIGLTPSFRYSAPGGNKSIWYYRDLNGPIDLGNPNNGSPHTTGSPSTQRANTRFVVCPSATYNLYMNGDLIAGGLTQPNYHHEGFDNTVANTWCVKIVCEDGSLSFPTCITMDPCIPCFPAENLTAEYDDNCCATLAWESPAVKFAAPVVITESEPFKGEKQTEVASAGLDKSSVYNGAPFVMSGESRGDYVYGIQGYYAMPLGHMKISIPNPGQGTLHSPFNQGTLGGEYYNGYYYCSSSADATLGNFYKVDHATGTYTLLTNHGAFLGDLTYDYSTQTMYAIKNQTELLTVNLNTGALTPVATLTGGGSGLITIACNLSGNMYGIELNLNGANMYSINKSTGVCTLIGPTGLTSNYAQGSTFDHETGIYYWCNYRGSGASNLCIMNLTTGAAVPVNSNQIGEICGVYIPYVNNLNIAKAPNPFTATPVGTSTNCKLNWTNPTQTVAGDPLTSITKIVLERNGTPVWENTTVTPGQVMSYTDNAGSSGNYSYAVYAVTSEGNGQKASASVTLGNFCDYTFDVWDTYGDGWNGSSITITVDGVDYGSVTCPSSNNVPNVHFNIVKSLPAGTIKFSFVQGSYLSEVGFKIFDFDGVQIYNLQPGGAGSLNGLFLTYESDCGVMPRFWNIYRDGEQIAWDHEGNTYQDCDPFDVYVGHTWTITQACAQEEFGESDPISVSLLACKCREAVDLFVEYTEFCDAIVTWGEPVVGKSAGNSNNGLVVPSPEDRNVPAVRAPKPQTQTSMSARQATGNIIKNTTPPTHIVVPKAPKGLVNVTLEAHDPWGDGSGVQLLLDNSATQYGNVIPANGAAVGSYYAIDCVVPANGWDVFSNLAPTNATCSCTSTGIVVNGSVTIQIPAGTYDWGLANPSPGDRIWAVGAGGGAGTEGRRDNYVFEDGLDYHFLWALPGNNDCVYITTTTAADPGTPGLPTNFTVTPVSTVLKANLAWTNPTVTFGGEPLASISKIVIVRDGTPIHEITNGCAVGGNMTWQDNNVPSAGEHCYEVYAVNAIGNGAKASDCGIFGNMCYLTFKMSDDDGDGWNGASIAVKIDGVTYASVTCPSGATYPQLSTTTVLVPSGELTLTWTSGNWDMECYLEVYNADDELIFVSGLPGYFLSGCGSGIGMCNMAGVFHTSEFSCGNAATLYNIYKNGVMIVEEWPETMYYDNNVNPFIENTWCVTALCEVGESDPICYTIDGICAPETQWLVFGVVANAKEEFIVGANLTLTGYTNYATTSFTLGRFEFEDVYQTYPFYAIDHYVLTINAPGYQEHTQIVYVNGHTNLGTITLLEIPYPPTNVVAAAIADAHISITWNDPVVPPMTLKGYKIFRLLPGEEATPEMWVTLTTYPIPEMYYNDYAWPNLAPGTYKWAVITCYAGGVESVAEFSNNVVKSPPTYDVTFIVKDCTTGAYLTDATVVFNGVALDGYVTNVVAGTYPYTITKEEYDPVAGSVTVVDKNVTVTECLMTNVGIIDFNLGDFNIYPNPAINILTLERASTEYAVIEIFNAMGSHIATYETIDAKLEINVVALSAGTYFIKVTEGDNSGVKSFVKK